MKDILLAFVHVFAMMAPWLVFGFLMVYNMVRPVAMGHHKCSSK